MSIIQRVHFSSPRHFMLLQRLRAHQVGLNLERGHVLYRVPLKALDQ
jgi:hypothetical protein